MKFLKRRMEHLIGAFNHLNRIRTGTNIFSLGIVFSVFILALSAKGELVQHLDATVNGSVVGSNPVTKWEDQSTHNNDAVDNLGVVTFLGTSLSESGLAGLDFGSTRNDLELMNSSKTAALLDFTDAAAGNDGFSVLVAFKVDSMPGQEQHVMGTRHLLNYFSIIVDPDGTIRLKMDGNYTTSGDHKVAAGDTVVIGVTYKASTGVVKLWDSLNNDVTSGTDAANFDFANGYQLRLGEANTRSDSVEYLRGMVGEVKIYNHQLSEDDFLYERNVMAEKWADIPIPIAVDWRVITANTNYPSDDVIMAAVSISDSGFSHPLPGDPETEDCTATFQEALDIVGAAGGGTVFVPEGHYRIDGPINMSANVTLRGRWREITEDQPAVGTIIRLYETGTNAVITLTDKSCGLRDLTFWHPEQDPDNINTNYPFVIRGEGNVMTLENITLVNAYKGIDVFKASYCCIRGIYGSPLSIGLTADQSFAVSRFDEINFSPDCWAWSGLTNSPADGGAHEDYIRENGLAVNIREMDGFYFQNSRISGYHNGLRFQEGVSGDDPHGDISYLTISNCTVALHILEAKSFKILGCTFSGTDYGIFSEHNTDMSINASVIEGGIEAIRATSGGDLNLVNCSVTGAESISGGSLVKNTYDTTMPDFSYDYDSVRKPAATNLFNVKTYGAIGNQSNDDTGAFQLAIATAVSNGGGIVFVPDGEYLIDEPLNLQSGVELRGVSGARQHADSNSQLGSLILINTTGGSTNGTPFLTLGDGSGVRGMSFLYLDQDIETFVPHPWMIQANGTKNYIIDCFATNPYQAAELNGDDHLVEYTFFGGILATYRANNCSGGRIQNCHIKPDFWRNIAIGSYPDTLTKVHETKWRQTQQIEVFHLNNCDDYSISSIFNHASHKFMTVNNSSGQTLMISAEQVQKGYTLAGGDKTFHFLNSSCNINSVGDYSGNYGIKTELGFTGNARFYVSSLWGTQDSTWDASDGKLYIQQCYVAGPSNRGCINFRCRPGGDIEVESGNSEMRFGLENEGSFSMYNFDFRKGCLFSATRDYVYDNLIDETYIVADINQDPALDYGIALDTNNVEMVDAMIMAEEDPAGLNDQRRVKAARLTSGRFRLDVTEPEFSDGARPDVSIEMYGLYDDDTTVEVLYHSDAGMVTGKTQTVYGALTSRWSTVSFSVNDALFSSTEDIQVNVVSGNAPLLAMVLVSSLDLPSRHAGSVSLSNDDNANTSTKTWTISSLNSTNPPVTGNAATATGAFSAAGELGAFDSIELTASSVMGWSTDHAQTAIAGGSFSNYLSGLTNGTVAGYQGNLGVDSSPSGTTDSNATLLGNSLLEALVYTVDAAAISSGKLYLTEVSFQRYGVDARTDFVIYDVSGNKILEQQWDANFNGPDAVSGSWELGVGDKIIVGTSAANGVADFRVDNLTLDILIAGAPPEQASAPTPSDGETDVASNVLLSWTAGSGSTSHHVYFGTDSTPPFQGSQASTAFNPGILQAATTYYWRVDEVNDGGTTVGALWSFTTENAEPLAWLDAAVYGSVEGDPVTNWVDQTGNGYDAVNAENNVYYPSISKSASGRPGLDFGIGRNSLELFSDVEAASWLDQSAGTGGFCVLVAFKCDALNTNDWNDLFGNSTSVGDGFGLRYKADGSIQAYLNGAINKGGAKVASGDTIVYAFNYNASTETYELWDSKNDNSITGISVATNFTTGSGVTLGSTTGGSRYFDGMVGEVKIYDSALSETDFAAERSVLVSKWILDVVDSYEVWASRYGGSELIGVATNDYDGDGMANLAEYATGGNPTNGSVTGEDLTLTYIDGERLVVHPELVGDDSLIYTLETRTNLVFGSWTNEGYVISGTNETGASLNYVTNSVLLDSENVFIRLKVGR